MRAYVVGTCDTKGDELAYVRDLIAAAGLPTVLVDLGTRSDGARADVTPREVAAHHQGGADAVLGDDRGAAVAAMADAFVRFVAHAGRHRRHDRPRRLGRHRAEQCVVVWRRCRVRIAVAPWRTGLFPELK